MGTQGCMSSFFYNCFSNELGLWCCSDGRRSASLALQCAEDVLGVIAAAREQGAALGLGSGPAAPGAYANARGLAGASADVRTNEGFNELLGNAAPLPDSVFAPLSGAGGGGTESLGGPSSPGDLGDNRDCAAGAVSTKPAPTGLAAPHPSPGTAPAGAHAHSATRPPAGAHAQSIDQGATGPAATPGAAAAPLPHAAAAAVAPLLPAADATVAPLLPVTVAPVVGRAGGSALAGMFGGRSAPVAAVLGTQPLASSAAGLFRQPGRGAADLPAAVPPSEPPAAETDRPAHVRDQVPVTGAQGGAPDQAQGRVTGPDVAPVLLTPGRASAGGSALGRLFASTAAMRPPDEVWHDTILRALPDLCRDIGLVGPSMLVHM